MASLNKVQLIGRLGRDPEIRYASESGTAICSFSLATSRFLKNPTTGESSEETEWHRCVFFGKQGENIQKYMRKGSQVYVEGRLRTRKYEKDGVTHYATEVIGENSVFLGGKGETGAVPEGGDFDYPEAKGFSSGGSSRSSAADEFSKPPEPRGTQGASSESKKDDAFSEDEDIPF